MSEGGGGSGGGGGATIGAALNVQTGSGLWSTPSHAGNAATAPTIDRLYFVAVRLARATVPDLAGFETTASTGAGGVARMGWYADAAGHDLPGALVVGSDTGDIDTTVAAGLLQAASAPNLAAGLWWLAIVFHVAVAAVRTTTSYADQVAQASPVGVGIGCGWRQDAVAGGALPAIAAPAATATTVPLVFFHRP